MGKLQGATTRDRAYARESLKTSYRKRLGVMRMAWLYV
jgi:hypothetical protein